ncbi:glyoxylate/succinic semialdehyde reductase 1-like [Hibiscus syriacus]|uniref:glyoxylate/succinic semialdehyde reductase 1-like n=1 Tax=Hibiscus syriacus TaxID=106335 RepID=UPI001923202E|nr:glyoxylate/succinic semialdehyde reductase 1-like [Hibiscus syriacus]
MATSRMQNGVHGDLDINTPTSLGAPGDLHEDCRKKNEVGFLGLGIMGKAMSMNLLKNGFKVTVWNRTLSKVLFLGNIIINQFFMNLLSDPAAALSVVYDKDGVLEQICSGKGYIDMSTADPKTSCKIGEAITSNDGQFHEAPVSGSKQPSETGQLVILAAGDKDELGFTLCTSKVNFFELVKVEGAEEKKVIDLESLFKDNKNKMARR